MEAKRPEPARAEEKHPPLPRDLGIGGAQHKLIQQRIKESAEVVGFRATIEKPILDGAGSVDLLLERGAEAIACEISVTTTIDHEVGNVAKCLKAGLKTVAVVTSGAERLQKIASAVRSALGAEAAHGVIYHTPDGFIDHLRLLTTAPPAAPAPPPLPAETVTRGFKVRRHTGQLSADERKEREEVAVRLLAEMTRRKTG